MSRRVVRLSGVRGRGDGRPPRRTRLRRWRQPSSSGQFSGSPDGNSSATIGGSQTTTHTTPGTSGSTGSSGSTGATPVTSTTGSASTNPLSALTGSGGGGAPEPATYESGRYFPTLALPALLGIQPTPGTPAKPGKAPKAPQITTQMVTDAAQVVAPTSTPHVEPGTRSYVNIPNNYWTEAPHGAHQRHRARPGDPADLDPDRDHLGLRRRGGRHGQRHRGCRAGRGRAVEHAYLRQGSYAITTSTTYNLTFVLPSTEPRRSPSPGRDRRSRFRVSEIQTRVSTAR